MAEYLMTVLTKSTNSWEHLNTNEVTMVAQSNPTQLKCDVIEHTKELFSDDDYMDDGAVNRASTEISELIEDIDGDDVCTPAAQLILDSLLDEDMVDINSIDISEFMDVSISIDIRALVSEIEENRLENELTYTIVFDAVGTVMYEVHDADSVLLGKVMTTWLEN